MSKDIIAFALNSPNHTELEARFFILGKSP